jgi:hypothetical protein
MWFNFRKATKHSNKMFQGKVVSFTRRVATKHGQTPFKSKAVSSPQPWPCSQWPSAQLLKTVGPLLGMKMGGESRHRVGS